MKIKTEKILSQKTLKTKWQLKDLQLGLWKSFLSKKL